MKYGCILPCCLVICSCTFEHSLQKTRYWLRQAQVVDQHQVFRQQGWALPVSSSIYVAVPQQLPLLGSPPLAVEGETTRGHASENQPPIALEHEIQAILCQALGQYFPLLRKASVAESQSQAIASARSAKIPFMLFPLLVVQQDQVNSVQELGVAVVDPTRFGRDRLRMQMLLFDTVNQVLIDSAVLDSRSVWVALQARSPTDMFSTAFANYAETLSGRHSPVMY